MNIYGVELPEGTKIIQEGTGIAIALGEATGPAHRVSGAGALVELPGGARAFVTKSPTVIDHEEHGVQALTERIYAIDRQAELDLSEEWRQVTD